MHLCDNLLLRLEFLHFSFFLEFSHIYNNNCMIVEKETFESYQNVLINDLLK